MNFRIYVLITYNLREIIFRNNILEIIFIRDKKKDFINIVYIYIPPHRILLPHFLTREENSISPDSGKFCGASDFVTLVCDAKRDCEIHTLSRQSRGSASKCIS